MPANRLNNRKAAARGRSAGSSGVIRGGECPTEELRMRWSVQRGTAADGDSSESRSGITEAFPLHVIAHAFRGRVVGGWGEAPGIAAIMSSLK